MSTLPHIVAGSIPRGKARGVGVGAVSVRGLAEAGSALSPISGEVDARLGDAQVTDEVSADSSRERGLSRSPGVEGSVRQDGVFHRLERESAWADGGVVPGQPVEIGARWCGEGVADVLLRRDLQEHLGGERRGTFEDSEDGGQGALVPNEQLPLRIAGGRILAALVEEPDSVAGLCGQRPGAARACFWPGAASWMAISTSNAR